MAWRVPGMPYAGCGLLMLLAGCATTRQVQPSVSATGAASWRAVVPPGTVRYRLALGEISSGATPFRRVGPVYPSDQLAACLPSLEVQARLIVDEAGKVVEVRVADEARQAESRHAFIAAVRTAALQWRFNPLQVSHWAADADGNSHVVDSEMRPFSATYVFRFECHAGTSAVATTTPAPSTP